MDRVWSLLVVVLIAYLALHVMYSNGGARRASKGDAVMIPRKPTRKASVVKPTAQQDGSVSGYEDYLIGAGLSQSVVDSHRRFVDDIQQTTTGASVQTELSGDVYDHSFVGLRRPDFSAIYVDPESRTVPGASDDQMPTGTRYDKCGLY